MTRWFVPLQNHLPQLAVQFAKIDDARGVPSVVNSAIQPAGIAIIFQCQ